LEQITLHFWSNLLYIFGAICFTFLEQFALHFWSNLLYTFGIAKVVKKLYKEKNTK